MIHLKKYEEFNVQDIMSIPTSITRGNEYFKNTDDDFIEILQPYYNVIKSSKVIKDLSPITYEILDNYVGFSFIVYYTKVMILSDKEKAYILINNNLIPLKNTVEMAKILENEA